LDNIDCHDIQIRTFLCVLCAKCMKWKQRCDACRNVWCSETIERNSIVFDRGCCRVNLILVHVSLVESMLYTKLKSGHCHHTRKLTIRSDDSPHDGDSKHLSNVGKFLPDYMLQHPKRDPEILLVTKCLKHTVWCLLTKLKLWACESVCSLVSREEINQVAPELVCFCPETIRDFVKVKTPKKFPQFESRWG
jgi:hypothetical protein